LAPQAAVSYDEHGTGLFGTSKITQEWHAIPNTDSQPVIELDLLHILHSEGVHGMTFSEDGKYLAVNGKRRVFLYGTMLWDQIDSPQVSQNHGGDFALQDMYYSPDANHLVGRGEDNVHWLWQILNQVTSTFTTSHIGRIEAVCYTPNGHYLVTCGSDRTARVWDISPAQLFHVHTIDIGYHALSMAISFDSQHIALGAPNGTIWLWNLAAGRAPPTCVPNPDSRRWKIDYLSFKRVGYSLVSCGLDGSIRICQLKPEYSGRPLRVGTVRTAQGQCEKALHIRLTPDLRWLLSCKSTGDDLIQSTETGVIHTVLKAHSDKPVALACSSASGSLFATASSDGQVRIWKMKESAS
jgi:WD40 repeat protein